MAPRICSFVRLKMAMFARANANVAILTNNCHYLKLISHHIMLRSITNYTRKFLTTAKSSNPMCSIHPHVHCKITSNSQRNFIRKCHVVPHNKNYLPFEEFIARRKQEASRSILVQVQSSNSHKELYAYCTQFGAINCMHHYAINKEQHFFLIEFNELSSARAALEAATHVNYDEVIPVQSQMLWFRNSQVKSAKSIDKNSTNSSPPLLTINGAMIPNNEDIHKRLVEVETISQQMSILYETWKLDEINMRLRFLTAQQLERSFIGLFPHITVFPFGSSVNGFGKRGCDLDLVLSLEVDKTEKSSSRFVFHTKSISSDSRIDSKRLMETIADSMQYFIPGVSNVRRILHARVPIIKYDQTLTGLECDLSMSNMTAVYMSELLYFYGEIDNRVRPLVFTIRQWAQNVGLTNPAPGRWITNFSITLLVLFYLQLKGILPTLKTLKNLAGTTDIRVSDHSVDCTFLRDVTKLPVQKINGNSDDLETLLRGFFEYYSNFDFPTKAVSINDGATLYKPDFSPLYICNPLETMLNVSKNVSIEETERMRLAFRNASWMLETSSDRNRNDGIISIFEKKPNVFTYVAGKRSVNIAALFNIPGEKKASSKSGKNDNNTAKKKVQELDALGAEKRKIRNGQVRRR